MSVNSIVQAYNPRSGKYVKIDKAKGKILSHKKLKESTKEYL